MTRTEGILRHCLSLRQVAGVHCTAGIASSCHVGRVHLGAIERSVRNDDSVVGCACCVSYLVPVVEIHDSPCHVVDHPVVTHPDVLEGAISDSCRLLCCELVAEVFAPPDAVVKPCSCVLQDLSAVIDALDLFGFCFEACHKLIDCADEVLVLCFEYGEIPHEDGSEIFHFDAFCAGSIRESDDEKILVTGSGHCVGELVHSPGLNT